jgi:sigma-B regulation protein RsbU (phosphoserine phosphatase)
MSGSDLAAVLAAFHDATHCEAIVWTQATPSAPIETEAATGVGEREPPAALPSSQESPRMVSVEKGEILVSSVPGPRRAWLGLGPCPGPTVDLGSYMRFMLPVTTQYLQSALEVEHAANELAERYEEINLLYTISEILGRTVSLDETAKTILTEISETVGARRASILVYNRANDALQVAAAMGIDPRKVPPIPAQDACSVSARVFRTQHPMIAEAGEMPCEQEAGYRRGAMLSVPIMWTGTNGAEPLGVVNLSDRRSGQAFTAGDQKLIAAIATQIGTAIQNARLVRASVDQERLASEMQLAHDLQMKLLPDADIVAPEATVAARVVSAESVGGDFYNLFRLGDRRTGVMIGDVSGHGYQAALIMALTMSASAIHAQTTADPGETLHALFWTVKEELTTTEMFISAFYGVVDAPHGELRYANTGHPHAFVLGADGVRERLAASDPPLGMQDFRPSTASRRWTDGDLLVLFTDGVSDARNRAGERLGEDRVLETIQRHRSKRPDVILEQVFRVLDQHTGDAARRDDLTLVILRT